MTMELVKNHLFNFELERKTKLRAETVVEDKNLVTLFAGSSNAEQVGNTVKCDKCGRLNHLAQDCYQNRLKCHKCGGLGHVRKSVWIIKIIKTGKSDVNQSENVASVAHLIFDLEI